jgi:5'-nucleotidase
MNEAGEMPMGRLIAEAQRRMVGAQVALMNPGGVRRDLDAGPVIWEDLFQAQPFGNTLVKATLTGSKLAQALEQGIYPSGANVQIAGINVWIDRSRPFGHRITKLILEDGTHVKPQASYTVVFNNFMGGGGDSYTVLRDASSKIDTGITDLDALIDYLKSYPLPATIPLEERMHLGTSEKG